MKLNSKRLSNRIFILYLVCSLQNIFAQSYYANHRKYWYFKLQLNNNFIKFTNHSSGLFKTTLLIKK